MKPTLYSYWRSSCSYRVRIALELKGIEYEYKPVSLIKDGGEQYSDEYKKLNPKSEVPYFIHGDFKTSQSMAIIQYIEEMFADGISLFSKDIERKTRVIELCEIIGSGIQPLQNLSVMKHIISQYNQPEEVKMSWGKYWIERGFNALEEAMRNSSGKYTVGDEVSAADAFLVPQVYNARRFNVDLAKYPTIERVVKNCEELEAVQRAMPENQPDCQ